MSKVRAVMLSPLSAGGPAEYLAWWLRQDQNVDLIHFFAIRSDTDPATLDHLADSLRDADFVIYVLGRDVSELSRSIQMQVILGPDRFVGVIPSSLRGVFFSGMSVLHYDDQAADDNVAFGVAGVNIRAAILKLGRRTAPTLFISYRRDDTLKTALDLYNTLARVYGAHHVFIDLETAQLGGDFERDVQRQIFECAAVIVLIGQRWVTARDHTGRRRLDNPNDFVFSEVTTALKRNVLVVPVLVSGAQLLTRNDLPLDLRRLADLPPISIDANSWQKDIQPLLRELDRVIKRESQ